MQENQIPSVRTKRSTETTFAEILTQQGVLTSRKNVMNNFNQIKNLLKQRYGDGAVARCMSKYGSGQMMIRSRRSIRKFIHDCRALFK